MEKLNAVAQTVKSVDKSADRLVLGTAVWRACQACQGAYDDVDRDADAAAAAALVVAALKAVLADVANLAAADRQALETMVEQLDAQHGSAKAEAASSSSSGGGGGGKGGLLRLIKKRS